MKKLLHFLPFALLLFACKKDEPVATPRFYPTEVVRTSSANTDVTVTRYSYNGANHLIQEIISENGKRQYSFVYQNNGEGQLQKKVRFNALDVPEEQDEFEYDAAGRLIRLNHSYLDMSGNATLHHYNAYTYNSAGNLTERTEFSPAGLMLKKLSYQLAGTSIEKVQAFRSDNSLELTSESHYDLQKHPLAATALPAANLPGNVTFYQLTDDANQVITSISSSIVYNEAGYPLKITQTYSGGLVLTNTYTYKQQ